MKKRTFLILGGVVVACAVVALVASRLTAGTASAQNAAGAQLGRVTQATLSLTVDSSGSVTPESLVTLSFGTSGTVADVKVQPGDHVKQGQVLATLDTADLELQVAQQQQAYLIQQAAYSMTVQPDASAVEQAKTALANAEAAYQLAQQKYAVNSTDQVQVSCNNVDNAKQSYDAALTAYNNYISNWRVQVNGTAEISPQKAQLDRAKAAYDQAVASCNLAKSGVNDTGIKSALAQLEQARVNLAGLANPDAQTVAKAKAQLDQARLSLQQAQRQLSDAQLVAPFDGVVTQVTAVAGGASGSAAIGLADISQYHVDVLVDETEIAQVQVGQKAELTFDALPQATATGVVSRIDPAGTISQGVVYYNVRVNLDPTQDPLLADMSANVRVILDTHANVLAVPGGAVRSDNKGYYVNVVGANGDAQRVDVTTGYTDGDLTEVSGNLQRGEQVYISEPPARQQGGFNLFGIRLGGAR